MILLDSSSSMTDLSKEVALTILDTLGQDDFVTVLAFSDKARLIPECVENLYAEYGPVKVQVQVGHLSNINSGLCVCRRVCRQVCRQIISNVCQFRLFRPFMDPTPFSTPPIKKLTHKI